MIIDHKHTYIFVVNYFLNADNIRIHNMRRKLNLHVQHDNTVLFKKITINMGISLYNKVPDRIKLRKNVNLYHKDLKIFC
jgi:hypothetical protein